MFFAIILTLLFPIQAHRDGKYHSRPIIIGHRGVAYVPELTIAAQSMAYGHGADIIEIDVCLSRDNQLIVIHDIYLNAVSNVETTFPNRKRSDGFFYVIDFDLEELRRLKVYERVQPLNKSSVFPGRFPSNSNVSFHLATLNETIEFILGLNRAFGQQRQLLIEIKKPEFHTHNGKFISDIVLNTLKFYNLTDSTDPVIIQTFHIEELIRIRRVLASRLRLFALMTFNFINESSSDYDFYRSEKGIQFLSKFVQAITPAHQLLVNYFPNETIINATNLTRWAHENGLAVYPFTFRRDLFPGTNFDDLLEYFWSNVQVDGFITDHPDLVRNFFERRLSRHALNNSSNSFGNEYSKAMTLLLLIMARIFRI